MEFKYSSDIVDYDHAHEYMQARVASIREDSGDEQLWLLEHPSLYTAGSSAQDIDLLTPERFPVYKTGRGGQYTYHGPGQRIGYVMLDLKKRQNVPDIKRYICDLEEWLIQTVAEFGVKGERRDGRVGIWVDLAPYNRKGEAKIAAIGVRIRRWVTFHGVALNHDPNLEHFSGIVPCGINEHGVTSLHDLGIDVSKKDLDDVMVKHFKQIFGS